MAQAFGAAPAAPAKAAPTTADLAIQAHELSKRFNGQDAVTDLTFAVPRGQVFGYIGPSGSGKTTTIRLLTGVYRPSSGKVTVLGRTPDRFSLRTREKIGYMPQHFVLYPELSVWENLSFAASIYGMGFGRGRRLLELLEFVELAEHRHKLARDISGGMLRRLSLAATLVHDPELIFLDEPTAGIDPVLRRKFWDHFRELQAQGRTLFITTQYVGETAYCDAVGVMGEGYLITVDTPDGLRQRAMGGDVIDLRTTERIPYNLLNDLADQPFVRQRRVTRLDEEGGVRLVVDEAATAMPALLEWVSSHNLGIDTVQEFLPPFDDVFVELVRRERESA